MTELSLAILTTWDLTWHLLTASTQLLAQNPPHSHRKYCPNRQHFSCGKSRKGTSILLLPPKLYILEEQA